jgi:hypothetical protein
LNAIGIGFAPITAMNFLLLLLLLLVPGRAFSNQNPVPEPSIQQVQQVAIRYLSYDQHQIDQWDKKAKLAAALPRIQVGFQRELKDVVSLTTKDNVSISDGDVFIGPSETNFDQNFNQGTVIGVKALWYLDQLIFNRDMLAASAERREWVRERNRVLQQVSEAYFTRRRLIQELKRRTDPLLLREKKKLLLDQAAAVLDADTGGWFSEQIQQGAHL